MAPTSSRAVGVTTFVLLGLAACAIAEPWNLPTYRLCRQVRLSGVTHEVSGTTYNAATNSLWVVTRRPRVIAEYTMTGRKLRTVGHNGLVDPEGIAWMWDYTFGVAEEGRGRGYAITIMSAEPWRRDVRVEKKIDLSRLPDQNSGSGLEALAFDPVARVFYAAQEQNPIRLYRVELNGRTRQMFSQKPRGEFYGRDFAGLHFRPGHDAVYVLSEAGETVSKISLDGRTIGAPLRGIRGRMPEGLTFTPDGALMIIAGEPDEMFFYTSVGTCDWTPGAPLPDYYDPPAQSAESPSAASWLDKPIDDNTIVVRLKLEGITPEQFSPLAQIYYKAAVAITAYGGSLDVLPLVTMPRVTSNDGAMFTEVHIKLRQGEDAEALRTTVEHAIDTGAFYTTLASLSFPHSDITVTIVETDEGDVEHVDGPDGAPYASGYEGYITLRISDLPPVQFTPLFQLYLRSAVSSAAYGSRQALSLVEVTESEPMPSQVGMVATLRILALTLEHGQTLLSNVSEAATNGTLAQKITELGSEISVTFAVGPITFRESEVPPEDFPVQELEQLNTASVPGDPDYETTMAFLEDDKGAIGLTGSNLFILIGCSAVGGALAAVIAVVAYRKISSKKTRLTDKPEGVELEESQPHQQPGAFHSPVASPARLRSPFSSPPLLGSKIKSPSRFPRSPEERSLLEAAEAGSGSGNEGSADDSHGATSVVLSQETFMNRLHAGSATGSPLEEEEPVGSYGIDIQADHSDHDE